LISIKILKALLRYAESIELKARKDKEIIMSKIHELMPWSRPSSIFVRRGEGFGSSLSSLQEDMNRLFEHFYNGAQTHLTDWDEGTIAAPSVNVVENGSSFRIEAELAGMDPKNVEVEVSNGTLTLKGERKEEEKEDGKSYLRREISYGSFTRTVALPETADEDKAKATFRNGILTVDIPKKPEAQQKPKKVEIKTAA
jgi:HSP20 family protein